jgi:hypothetical protein
MAEPVIALIHPPVAKPSEAPAGIARLTGALTHHGVRCRAIDANIQGLHHLLHTMPEPRDTWGRRAYRHRDRHLLALRSADTCSSPDRYRRAVADLNRLLALSAGNSQQVISLADFQDRQLSPLDSNDLITSARVPEANPFFDYFQRRLLPELLEWAPTCIGLSINYLSQVLCAFALIGVLRRTLPEVRIVIGGGLVTSWLQRKTIPVAFSGLIDDLVAGPGESHLLRMAGINAACNPYVPDYSPFTDERYLAPGPVLPFSASHGCWWRRCAFCPEHAERRPFQPLPFSMAVNQLKALTRRLHPAMIHLLDNAISPALLKSLVADPPGAPWYGFVRIGAPLNSTEFCAHLAASGCVMLKIGLESGDQKVLDALNKGVRIETAVETLHSLHAAGIATYVYLLFGTPAEEEAAAWRTLQFVADHSAVIDFLNLAIFNLPANNAEGTDLNVTDFYKGDLSLYKNFEHPRGWSRPKIRQFLDKQFKRHSRIRPIILNDPPIFTSNHAAFFPSRKD